MKKKFLTLLLTVIFIIPCAFIFTACTGEEPTFNGYEVYINGTKTNEFTCTIGEEAITPEDITIKSSWSDTSKNEVVPLSDFEISVKWKNQDNFESTELPNFWTNGTGLTTDDFVTTYEFSLAKDAYYVTFDVIISPIKVENCRIRIFDGNEYKYSTDMVWGYNGLEEDSSKHYKVDIENLDSDYNQHEHIQWAYVEKDVYDALETEEQKKAYFDDGWKFSQGLNLIPDYIAPGTYYIFAYVPDCNNKQYGEYGDGIIYNYASLTIKPIELQQVKVENRILQHDDSQYKNDFNYLSMGLRDEIKTLSDVHDYYVECFPQVMKDGSLQAVSEFWNESIKVNAVKVEGKYKLVELKDFETSRNEWVFVNEDGTQGDAVTDNSKIEVVDYKDLEMYINNTSITIPVYYMVNDMSSHGIYYNCTKLYKTEVKIRKYINILVPIINKSVGGATAVKYVTDKNTFEFTYGDKYQITYGDVLKSPEEIMHNIINYSTHYRFEGFDQTAYSTEPYYGYLVLESPHYAWKLDGTNYTSESLKVTYYINKKAVIENPEYVNAEGSKDYFVNPIEVTYDAERSSYKLSDYITIANVTNEDVCYESKWVNVYSYLLAEGDELLSRDELIQKIRTQGTNVGYDGLFAEEQDNISGKTFVIMYDLSDTQNTEWQKVSTSPNLFKITIK